MLGCSIGGDGRDLRRLRKSTPFFLDSQSAEDRPLDPVFYKQSKRVAVNYHWIRQHVNPDKEERTADYVPTGDQTAET